MSTNPVPKAAAARKDVTKVMNAKTAAGAKAAGDRAKKKITMVVHAQQKQLAKKKPATSSQKRCPPKKCRVVRYSGLAPDYKVPAGYVRGAGGVVKDGKHAGRYRLRLAKKCVKKATKKMAMKKKKKKPVAGGKRKPGTKKKKALKKKKPKAAGGKKKKK